MLERLLFSVLVSGPTQTLLTEVRPKLAEHFLGVSAEVSLRYTDLLLTSRWKQDAEDLLAACRVLDHLGGQLSAMSAWCRFAPAGDADVLEGLDTKPTSGWPGTPGTECFCLASHVLTPSVISWQVKYRWRSSVT